MRMINRLTKLIGSCGLLIAVIAWSWSMIPPPQRASAQFFAQQGWAGTSGGTANVQTLTVPNMDTLVKGVPITFIPGATNTGPTTITINAVGATATLRPSSIGLVALSGGELQIGVITTIMYDGTNLDIVSPVSSAPISSVLEGRFASAPPGYLLEDGSCVSRTTYAPLFSVISTIYGVCDGSTTFGLPDSRGTMTAALDNQGANGSANRITNAGSGCTATSLVGSPCGSQVHTLIAAEVPNLTTALNSVALTVANLLTSNTTTQTFTVQAGGGTSFIAFPTSATIAFVAPTLLSGNGLTTTGGGGAHAILNPVSLVRRAIKY